MLRKISRLLEESVKEISEKQATFQVEENDEGVYNEFELSALKRPLLFSIE